MLMQREVPLQISQRLLELMLVGAMRDAGGMLMECMENDAVSRARGVMMIWMMESGPKGWWSLQRNAGWAMKDADVQQEGSD
jgi:hypothetical protein